MKTGLVSTVIPVFNRGPMLRQAVDSVLAQSWRPIEIIIVDDGSTDDTVAVAHSLAELHPGTIRVLQQSNAGPGVARQAGLDVAAGEFVQFLDSDDLLLPEKFSLQVNALREDEEADIAYGKCLVSRGGVPQEGAAQSTGESLRQLFPALLDGPLWPTLTPLYRRSALSAIGPWPPGRQLEDWIYDAQAGALGTTLHYVDEFIAETREHDENRLCHLWIDDPRAMEERLAAYPIVLSYSCKAGVDPNCAHMRRFARTLFFMARTAGASGHLQWADKLLRLARQQTCGIGWDIQVFRLAVAAFGWRGANWLATQVERRRP